ncbi:MAG: hypothetical protein CM15mP98_06770 [Paracoccaceae bacterium]|nr:MAG: hypothetical protein CM15mP98_06770 [Paracoccaceae bacterium]
MVSSRKLSSEEVDALIEGLQSDDNGNAYLLIFQNQLVSDHISLVPMSYHCWETIMR